MRLKSVNFTSTKVHNFHSLLLAPVYHVIKLHFSFARCPDITPPCHSNLYHFIQVLIISCLGTILASLYSQSPLHLYSLLLLPPAQASLGLCPTPSLTSSVVKVWISYIVHHGPPQFESNCHFYPQLPPPVYPALLLATADHAFLPQYVHLPRLHLSLKDNSQAFVDHTDPLNFPFLNFCCSSYHDHLQLSLFAIRKLSLKPKIRQNGQKFAV